MSQPDGLPTGTHACRCRRATHRPKLIVLTGGPGGGKTAVLEMARRYFCQHVAIAPEAASIVFGGGFPRPDTPIGRRAAQRAIFHVQREMERLALASRHTGLVLCDRGSLDGLAYWPGSRANFFREFGTTQEAELNRYAAVVHVEVPSRQGGFEQNKIRRESAAEARRIDQRIAQAWRGHPRVLRVSAQDGFLDKLAMAIDLLTAEVPACCRHAIHR